MAYKGVRFRYILAGSTAVSLISGGALGYVVANKKLEAKYIAIAQEEIADAKVYYAKLNKAEKFSDPSELAKQYVEEDPTIQEIGQNLQAQQDAILEQLHYKMKDLDAESLATRELEEVKLIDVAPVQRNVFDTETTVEELDPEDEMKERDRTRPYIISHDEFFENEDGNAQSQYTYFSLDKILVDEGDEIIQDLEFQIGEANLRFGYLSQDPNIVYIRNEKLGLDFEVMRSRGSYAQEVAGILEHSDSTSRLRKFRDYD